MTGFRSLLFFLGMLVLSPVWAVSLNDSGHISLTRVSEIIQVKSEADIAAALQKAKAKHLPVGIMGVQHSQGGQSIAPEGIQLNMLPFNQVLNVDAAKKQVTVQSGITWGKLQEAINPYQLAITAMQSPNIFTVGGSLSVNAHGDDFRMGAVGNSIVSFSLRLADGRRLRVSPEHHPDLWCAVRGGYGVLGVVTDVTLQLTDNTLLTSHYNETLTRTFPDYFRHHILNNRQVVLFYAHMNIVPNASFLNDMYVITYTDTGRLPSKVVPLENPERWNAVLTPLFNVSRNSLYGKHWRWKMEKRLFKKRYGGKPVTRNNAMEKPVRFAANYRPGTADWLQEYFIPVEQFPSFIDQLRKLTLSASIDLLNVTVRYVPAEPDLLLSQVRNDSLSVVLYFNQSLSAAAIEKTRQWTEKVIDAALASGGSYYLTYQNFASQSQFEQAYPRFAELKALKRQYDKNNRFSNKFYQKYYNLTINT
ncbi:FAD-binding protein [Legionella sp. MW5194]|uniref:FAD-dependent oxidoreductase n=1 Tax=Legionella sp. MW5194 TaxID=2662448 RepID=UPI00193D0A64|nr:FAD-binding oxidoreductase [Legionella sp. MW5194]QRN02694.1 FAD-binding protein [Legionella sp. MW5194]